LPSAEVVPDREAYSSDLLWRLDELGFRRAILVDTTAPGSGTGPVLAGMRRAGCDVVLANREPLAGSGGTYDLLTRAGRGRLRWGATLPPGLPLQEAIRRATRGADRLRSIVCAPSGALGWILDALVRGSRFSTAVREAQLRGLLHSDPREDLSGRDARRLALLLARAAGWPLEADCLGSEGLVPDVADRLPPGIVLDHLTDLDTYYADRVRRAGKRGAVLRYVVRMGPHGGTAGLEELPSDDVCARALEGDTVFAFYTEHGGNHPVVLQGPAGGADATAASLFSDIVSLL
ncbi:MAG TPA: hypothetical protein VM536_01805, partial [Chloroflexia bacterium]|nr:hypothetical protein [Chloroflexia bacterium]